MLRKKAVDTVLLFFILLAGTFPSVIDSGVLTAGKRTYQWRILNGNLQISSYPTPPTRRTYIIIEKSTNSLYLYRSGRLIKRYDVATGRDPAYTPEGKFRIARKASFPDKQRKSGSEAERKGKRAGEGDQESDYRPDPRLGLRWLGLSVPETADKRKTGPDSRAPQGLKYGIHGTNEPASIGKHISGGCIRMHNQDVVELYDLVPKGTIVEIRP